MADQSPPEDVQNENAGRTEAPGPVSPVETDAVSSAQPDTIELPTRLRVHALAKILGVTSKQLLVTLGELGIEARSAQSSLSRDVAESVRDSVNGPTAATLDSSTAEPTPVPDVDVPAADAPTDEVPWSEPQLFTSAPAPESKAAAPAATTDQPTATTFATPLFLQPAAVDAPATESTESTESPAEPPARRRRSRKAAPKHEAANAESSATTDSRPVACISGW